MKVIFVLLAFFFSSFAFGGDDGTSPFLGVIDERTPLPAEDYVYFLSPGGHVDKAFEMVPFFRNKTCIVFGAGSAALMILLPACKERYYVQNARVVFHSAVYLQVFGEVNQQSAEEAAEILRDTNQKMLLHMVQYGMPFEPDIIKEFMKQNTLFVGSELQVFHPWMVPVEQCQHCPFWTKMLQVKPAFPTPSGE
jgi:hypothetical protein